MVKAIDIISKLAPNAKPQYREAFSDAHNLLDKYGINTPLRLCHFLAQAFHETGNLTILVESGRYSAKALAKMWDGGNWHKYFANRDACLAMADKCAVDGGEALFNLVYQRKELGNDKPGDGWKYRGRGIMQTTGKWSYTRYAKRFGVDFVGDPDLICSGEHALKPALAEWEDGHLNAAADANDIEVITKRINGGLVGLADRKARFARIWAYAIKRQAIEETVEFKVQARLKALGYAYVEPDGDVGVNTRTAILDYRAKHGLPVVPTIRQDLLDSLGVA